MPLADYTGNGPDWRAKVKYDTAGLEPVLEMLYWAHRQGALSQAVRQTTAKVDDNSVLVTILMKPGEGAAAVEAVTKLGGRLLGKPYSTMDAWVPIASLRALAQHPAVLRVEQLRPPQPAVIGGGVGVIGAPTWHDVGNNGSLAIKGRGVKIGVIDTSFLGYDDPNKLGSELPANLDISCSQQPVVDDNPNLGEAEKRHGTMVAEIIHEIAPDAEILIARAGSEAQTNTTVDCMAQKGVRVINHSANYGYYGGPGDGTGPIVEFVDRAVDLVPSIFWANSTGNKGIQHWGGPWLDVNDNAVLDFAPNRGEAPNREFLQFRLKPGEKFFASLRWSDVNLFGIPRWLGACGDYDLFLSNQASSDPQFVVTQQGVSPQLCRVSDVPTQVIDWQVPNDPQVPDEEEERDYYLHVKRVRENPENPNAPVRFDLLVSPTLHADFRFASGSLDHPADSASPGMVAVGAVDVLNPTQLMEYSSQGPTTDNRHKPDLVGPTDVQTSTGGFGGTSGASPHVAGAAALVLQANPSFAAADIKDFLVRQAVDLPPDGIDDKHGAGRVILGALSPYVNSVAQDHPLGYWRLNDVGTTARDLGVQRLDGTISGGAGTAVEGALAAADDPDKAMLFNGSTAQIALPPGFANLANGVTLEAWIYPSSNAASARIIELGNASAGDNIMLSRGSPPDLTFQVYNGTTAGAIITAPGVLVLNTWQHVAATVDGAGNATIYWNGQRVASGQTGAPRNVARNSNYIGRGSDSRYFAGSIDEVAVYPSVLTAGRLQAHFAKGAAQPIASTALVDHIPIRINGENGVRLQYREAGNYFDIPNAGNYTYTSPTFQGSVPAVAVEDFATGIIYEAPGYNDRHAIIRVPMSVALSGSFEYVRIRGIVGTHASTSLKHYIYRGAGNYAQPLWTSGAVDSFDVTIPYLPEEELFFATDAMGDAGWDQAFWQDVRFQGLNSPPDPTVPIAPGTSVRLADFFPRIYNGELGMRLQRRVGTTYTDLSYNQDYQFISVGWGSSVPSVQLLDAVTGKIRTHPGANGATALFRVKLSGSFSYVKIWGFAGNDNGGPVRHFIYKGADGYTAPLWNSYNRGSFSLVIQASAGDELFFSTDPNGDYSSDWGYWRDVRVEAFTSEPPAPTVEIVPGTVVKVADYFPRVFNGEAGVRVQRRVGSAYEDLTYSQDYNFGSPDWSHGVPHVQLLDSTTGKFRAHPGANGANALARVRLSGSFSYLRILGNAGDDNTGSVRHLIYKGSDGYVTPLFNAVNRGSFSLVIQASAGDELFFSTDPNGDYSSDWGYWQDLRLEGLAGPPPPTPTPLESWNLAADFRSTPDQENPNRDSAGRPGVWHFLGGSGLGRDPGSFGLLTEYTVLSGGVSYWGPGSAPSLAFNSSDTTYRSGSAAIPPRTANAHPGSSKVVVVGWQSPISGTVAVHGRVSDNDPGGGDGVLWYVMKNGSDVASGYAPNGGYHDLDQGIGGETLSNVSVVEGDFIYLVIHPYGGYGWDSTGIDLTIDRLA